MTTPDPKPRVQLEPEFERTWPGASALATACVINLGVLVEQMTAFGESAVRKHGIPSRAAFNVLAILLGAGEPLPPSVIAARMILSRPTMTGILGSLERRGLIRRSSHPADGRMTLVEITPDGGDRVGRLRPELHQAEKQWMACLDEAEQRVLLGMLARLQANSQTP